MDSFIFIDKNHLQEESFALLQRGIQYSSSSERPKTTFKSGFAYTHNQELKNKASENIPGMCKIMYTVNIIVPLDIKECIELIVRMSVIFVAW